MEIKKHAEGAYMPTAIPDWILHSDTYSPSADKEAFLRKTIAAISRTITFFGPSRYQVQKRHRGNITADLLLLFVSVLLIVSAHSVVFPLLILAIELVYLAALDGKQIRGIIKPAVIAFCFSCVLVFPSLFLGNNRWMELPFKVFITVLGVSYVSRITPLYEIGRALRAVHIPCIFILVWDMTIKYIVLLGHTILHLLISLRLRSVGKNDHKYQSMAAIMGTTFLKSQEYAKDTYHAMVCRCFTGTYEAAVRQADWSTYIMYGIAAVLLIGCYLFLEGYIG